MDGFEFLQKVRANPDWIHIPFIFLTARGEKRDIKEGRSSGADLYVVKPFDSSELLELIESQLTRSFRLQETRQRDVDSLKKNILQILNHEFRTPLTYVTAYYEMLADGVSQLSSEQDLHEYLRGIQAGCVRLTSLVDDLIQVIELRTGEAEVGYRQRARQIDNVSGLLEQVVRVFRPRSQENGIELHLSFDGELPPILGDADSLVNILERLIGNAIKFTRSRARQGLNIFISARADEREVHIRIEDEGIGFPIRIQRRIFESFFQYNRELMEQQGAGVGLTIAKGLVDLHRGRIEAESQEGVGSVFTLILPAYSESGEDAGNDAEIIKRATVLIVEDDVNLLNGLQELLEISSERYLYDTLTAANGVAGLEVLSGYQPDLIISDIMMPKMGGFEFLQQVRKNPDWVQIPFIFLTAKGQQRDIHDGLRSGVEEYITKPYESDELLDLVATQLDRHFQVQGVVSQNFEALKRSILDLITPDFRLPLSSVTQYSDKLAHGFGQAETEEDLKASLHGIQASSLRLASLVEDFISLAELKTGEAATAHELNARPIPDVGLLLRQAGQKCADEHAPNAPRFHYATDIGLSPVLADGPVILESLERLIAMGIKLFGLADADEVQLAAEESDGMVSLSIRFPMVMDSEMKQTISRILTSDELEQLDSRSYAPSLTIAKGYVELHNGRIELNADDAQGFTYTVMLPPHKPSSTAIEP
jgi:signal transduction histidine kinase